MKVDVAVRFFQVWVILARYTQLLDNGKVS